MEFRIAIVEDNATARTALRGHLMSIANLSVSSFASGVELKAALKKQNFELLLMDYHLGQGKTGVEWIQSLRGMLAVGLYMHRLPTYPGQAQIQHRDQVLLTQTTPPSQMIPTLLDPIQV